MQLTATSMMLLTSVLVSLLAWLTRSTQILLLIDFQIYIPLYNFLEFYYFFKLLLLFSFFIVFINILYCGQYFHVQMFVIVLDSGYLPKFIVMCALGEEKDSNILLEEGNSQTITAQKKMEEQPLAKKLKNLFFCFLGLQVSYLTWGILQERIMTNQYGKTASMAGEYFGNSQFLVFINRILALMCAVLVMVFQSQPTHTAPLYKYSFSSFSNVMSSWFQYEALKFVSFPTQVRA